MSHPESQDTNPTNNPTFDSILEKRYPRRDILKGGFAAAAATFFGGMMLTGCDDNEQDGDDTAELGFTAVAKNTNDMVTVPAGYTARVLYSWGDPIIASQSLPTPSIANLTSAQQANAAGDHHDGMYYFGLGSGNAVPGTPDRNNSDRGLLAINHEAITEDFAHARGPSYANLTAAFALQNSSTRTSTEECLKEQALHGVSIVEVAKTSGQFATVKASPYNRRLTVNTEMQITGPVAAKPELILTKFSAQTGKATRCRGTLNNCANGFTPWGTYLTCEENWAGYFGQAGTVTAAQTRNGIALHGFQNLRWYTAPDTSDNLMSRFQLNPTGATAAADFRNEANTFGYVVEVDPYDPTSIPKKRSALGRFAHEGCWPSFQVGKKMAFYQGDDNRNDYFYKFVTDATFTGNELRVNDILDTGTLYVARFNADGSGVWLPLTVASVNNASFPTQGDICADTRRAADLVNPTRMDRPEWAAVSYVTGEVYLTLTNNSNRRPVGTPVTGSQLVTDPANPRAYVEDRAAVAPFITASTTNGNANGHIIRVAETGSDPAATTFRWDIYLFGAQADASAANVNLSGLTADNDFSSPDGVWFGRKGNAAENLLWIQTDDGQYTDVTNCMMLAAIPGAVGDGANSGNLTINNTVGAVTSEQATKIGKKPTTMDLRRFLVGPRGAEITGIDSTPDGKTLFVNIQHPGELGGFNTYDTANNTFAQQSTFNLLTGDNRARSATIVITKDDGGIVGLK